MTLENGKELDRRCVINWLLENYHNPSIAFGSHLDNEIQVLAHDALVLLKAQDEVVHPEPSCEMTYITDCCCDLCGVQLIREDNFCRCCGKRIVWEGR